VWSLTSQRERRTSGPENLQSSTKKDFFNTILLPPDASTLSLHSVALEYFLATLAQLRAVLLQTLLNRVVVAQLLPAKSLCVSRARLLLLRRAHMALS
jgi:hypothetical protein